MRVLVTGAGGQCPGVLSGGVVDDEIDAQVRVTSVQRRRECAEIVDRPEASEMLRATIAWRAGLRYDWLNSGSVEYGNNAAYLTHGAFNPQRTAVMLDWTPSEFSRFRIQYQQAKLRPDFTDNEFFLQYILTLGAHGAHKF